MVELAVLDNLERQPESAILAPVDTPRGVEVAKGVETGALRRSALGHHASRDLYRCQPARDDIGMVVHRAGRGGEAATARFR